VITKYGRNYRERNYTLNVFTCNGLQSKIQEGDRRFLVGGYAKADNKARGLEFERWVNGPGPNYWRYYLLHEVDCSGYDDLDTSSKIKEQVIESSKTYKATVKNEILDILEDMPGLECLPNNVLTQLLEPHRVNTICFVKEHAQYFVQPGLKVVKINGMATRFRAFKNLEKWKLEDDAAKYREQYDLAIKLINLSTKKY